jgi:hypothetical protein
MGGEYTRWSEASFFHKVVLMSNDLPQKGSKTEVNISPEPPFTTPAISSAEVIRLHGTEDDEVAKLNTLRGEFGCLAHVEHYQTGGLGDQIAGVIARYREDFHTVRIEAPRPAKGVARLPWTCPVCGKPVLLESRSWLRTNLLLLGGLIALGCGIAVLGWLNSRGAGVIAIGFALFGVLVALFPLLISLAAPNLLDHLPGAFRLVEDVARDPSMQPTPGGMPETKSHRELKETRRNQHRLEKVQLIRRDRE